MITTWRHLLPAAAAVLLASGCQHEQAPRHWVTEAACEAANPGMRCEPGMCDLNCGGHAWSGWVPYQRRTPSPTGTGAP